MAKAPLPFDDWPSSYGPHLNYTPSGGWQGESSRPETLVKTHCCFCGQQCGIQLKVRDNRVVGFEPWEEFPFNRGMLCPKGVKRYLQGNHPDRLLDPLLRTDRGFRHRGLGRSARFHRAPPARAAGKVRPRFGRGLRRRVAHHREGVPDGQVRARGAGNPAHRLQRPPLHGVGRHGLQRRAGRGPRAQPLERYRLRGSHHGDRRQYRRVRSHHHRLHLARPRQGRQADRGRPALHSHRAQCRPVSARASRNRPRAADGHAARDRPRRPHRWRFHRGAHHGIREDRGIGGTLESAPRRRSERVWLRKPSSGRRIGSANRAAPC